MPNTPALIHKGAAAYAPGKGVTGEDTAVVEKSSLPLESFFA